MTKRTLHYEQQVELLKTKLTLFLEEIENTFERTIRVLKTGEEKEIQRIIDEDEYFDQLNFDIQEIAYEVIGKFNPLADDLRFVVTVIRLASDLERIADECVNVAEVSRTIQNRIDGFASWDLLNQMLKSILVMLKGVVNASVYKDLELAIRVWKMDDQVDLLHNEGHEMLISMACEEREDQKIRVLLEEAFLIRHLERIADHVTNIAEELYYIETGNQLKQAINQEAADGGKDGDHHA